VTGCAAVPMVCVPLPDGRYRMSFDAPILPEGEGEDEIERLTRRYAAAMEHWIRERPELWLWMHTRWQRTRKQRRPAAIAKLVEESGLPPSDPRDDLTRGASPGARAALARLSRLATDQHAEEARHLLIEGTPPADAIRAAASFAGAIVRLGHATRWLTLGELCDRLARARSDGRLAADLRELDPIPMIVIAATDPRSLDCGALALVAAFLDHRRERGSVVLAGAGREAWRDAARGAAGDRASIDAFLDLCEVVVLDGADPRSLPVGGSSPQAALDPGEDDASARAVRV